MDPPEKRPTPAPAPPHDAHKTQIQIAKIGLASTLLTTAVAAIVQISTARGNAHTGPVTSPVVTAPASAESERVRGLRETLRRQQDTLLDLRGRGLTDEHPQVIAARRRIDQLQLEITQEISQPR